MRSQEQLWLQNPLSSFASGASNKQAHWRVMAVKRLLTHIHSQAAHAHYNALIYSHVHAEALAGHGYGRTSQQEAQARMNVIARDHNDKKSLFIAHQQVNLQNFRFGETGNQRHSQVDSPKLGLGYGLFRAQQQLRPSIRDSGYSTYHSQLNFQGCRVLAQESSNAIGQSQDHRCNESQGPVRMKVQGHGSQKPVAQQEEARQAPIALIQQVATQRPMPKRLLPIPITRRSLSTTTRPPPLKKVIAIADSIKLTDLEFRIFNILKACLVHFNLNTQLRVAGGWVRDKLLGKQCGDIDIALDDMRGRKFCRKLSRYCHMIGMESIGVGVVKSKPTQAKHLEVAKVDILGVSIDFVNLRPPDYTESKPSTMQDFGTAVEDAFLRDFTINSLFYNINTAMVEDPTGKGLSDLKAGMVATPSPAKETFRDDPLRVLRALRFVAALDYELHPDAKDAIDADIKLALAARISRERIGGEVDRIFKCSQPLKAMELLVETQLFPIVFSPPTELGICLPEGIERTCLHALGATIDVLSWFGSSKLPGEHRKSLYLAAFLSPLRTLVYEHKSKLAPISTAIIKESLKLRSIDAAMVATINKSADNYTLIRKLILKMHAIDQCDGDILNSDPEMQTTYSDMKLRIGKLLEQARGLWRSALLLGTVLEEEFLVDLPYENRKEELRRRLNLCIFVEEAIVKLGLEEITGPIPFIIEKRKVSENG